MKPNTPDQTISHYYVQSMVVHLQSFLMQESFHYFKYKKSENTLYEYADDIAPRHLTSALPLDYDTIAGGDKFGNVFITRLPADISAQVCSPPRRHAPHIIPCTPSSCCNESSCFKSAT